jgi:hypothetical protein
MRACRVFLAGEGTSDIGDLAHPAQYRRGVEGLLQPLIRRILGQEHQIEFEGVKLTTLAKTKVKVPHKRYARHAAQAHVLAEEENADALVFCCDVDRQAGTKKSPREVKARIKELVDPIDLGLREARRTADRVVPTIVATPCRMIEAWALGDPTALQEMVKRMIDMEELARPEELWGREHDREGRHPKAVLARILGSNPDFAAIGEAIDLVRLEQRCPLSFRPFVREVEAVIGRYRAE